MNRIEKTIISLVVLVFALLILLVATNEARDDQYVYLPLIGRDYHGLLNPSFEGKTEPSCRWWEYVDGMYEGPFTNCFNEQTHTPGEWTSWWIDREPSTCPGGTLRPEVTTIDRGVDPLRVYDGQRAAKVFTAFGCHWAGLYQVINLPRGRYNISVMGHSCYSHTGGCPPIAVGGHMLMWLGVDPTGGEDPMSDNIIWSEAREYYATYGILEVTGLELEGRVTVFLMSMPDLPFRNSSAFWDYVHIYGDSDG